ncbi:hypothetical protein Desdi_1106 [Desulfitobacterium dichloroeliminans LMG P-21439]|uniref:Uncharacterized protein n=1 Tax=Desulfitobacterium dichloroeliminans (strain LMG P-21439 / DCA1) TaxID=871963 RepID=L0F7K0_DESDL|nr:hypothetical protein [Desulfitobacterium dichloroeliminans]AGA68621.1 hypothetical protein Desdi_1106 [Desulfitobacterium dichloroeliminans LMG P-21439]
MSNQWGRPSRVEKNQSILKLVSSILVIGIIAYLIFTGFKDKIYPLLKPTYASTNSNNDSLPSPNNSSALNTSTYSAQDSPSPYNLSVANENNEVTTGYWLLFVAKGQMSQLSVESGTITFIQQLIERDRKTTGKNTLALVENGRFRQYIVSDEIYSVVSNLSVINIRVSESSENSSVNSSDNSSLTESLNPNLSAPETTPNPSTEESANTNNSGSVNTPDSISNSY